MAVIKLIFEKYNNIISSNIRIMIKKIRKSLKIDDNYKIDIIISWIIFFLILISSISLFIFLCSSAGEIVTNIIMIFLIIDIFLYMRTSFFINVAKAFVTIILLLLIIFKIAPHTAFVSLSGSGNLIDINTTADSVSFYSDAIRTGDDGEVYFNNYKTLFENKNIESDVNNFILKGCFQFLVSDMQKDNREETYVDDIQSLENGIVITAHSNSTTEFNENEYVDTLMQEVNGNNITSGDGNEKYVFHALSKFMKTILKQYIYPIFLQEYISSERDLILKFSSDDSTFHVENERIEVDTLSFLVKPLDTNCTLIKMDKKFNNIGEIPLSDEFVLEPLKNSAIYFIDHCTINSEDFVLDVRGAAKVETDITGKMTFTYGDTPKRYDLSTQTLSLSSKQGDIDCNIRVIDKERTISLQGEVSKALRSNVDLFPSFGTWYRNNVYLIPLTLISTIFAGVSLMKTQNSKKDKSLITKVYNMIHDISEGKELENDNEEQKGDKQKENIIVVTVKTQTPIEISTDKK